MTGNDCCGDICSFDDDRCVLSKGHDGDHEWRGPAEFLEHTAQELLLSAEKLRAYPSPDPRALTFLLEPNDDTEITCIFCRRDQRCEYAFTVRRDGERALVGIHEKCLDRARQRNDLRTPRAKDGER
jgi:hypothetical protein